MSEKFDMKLVIDPLATPLLHARLTAIRSARERATVLRSLAEAALRGTGQPVAHILAPAAAIRTEVPERFILVAPPTVPGSAPAASVKDLRSPINADATNEEAIAKSHDVELIADEFAAFLG